MLAGNWPYWNPEDVNKHPDELLRARLTFADSSKSLVEQDLVELAEGLEGRSTNPVSLLVSRAFNSIGTYTHQYAHTYIILNMNIVGDQNPIQRK